MAQIALSITDLAAMPLWPDVKKTGEVVIQLDQRHVLVPVTPCSSGMRFFVCPNPECKARCRKLFYIEGEHGFGCRHCAGETLHPDNRLLGSSETRRLHRSIRQIVRLAERLEHRPQDRNGRRRLRRRQQRLLESVHVTLENRLGRLEEQMHNIEQINSIEAQVGKL